MARRRLSQQQKRRIEQTQAAVDINHHDNHPGLVISHRGGEVEVEALDGDQANIQCNLRSNLDSIVCGDRVIYQQSEHGATIVAIQPRENLLQRLDGFGQIKAVAANVTQLIICLSVEPQPNLFLLDQYLLSAEQQGIQALIVLNKIDLLDDSDSDPFNLIKIYQPLGYQILFTSIKNQHNIDRLQQHCRGHTNVISGVSGVGKSSLTRAILPDVDIRIGKISEASKEGRHTTRTSRLYHLPLGGDLIDTPGVRGFNPVADPAQTIASGFREISQAGHNCKFSNCRHVNEPKCAVIMAVENGDIDSGRYQNYLKLLEEWKS